MTDSSDPLKSVQEKLSSSLVDTTRTAGQLASEDLGFQRSLNPSVASRLDRQNARLLETAGRLMNTAASGSGVEAPQLKNLEAVEEDWQGVVDVIDSLLERADACLDEYAGVVMRLSPSRGQEVPAPAVKATGPLRSSREKELAKPQLLFAKIPRNDQTTPFRPLLTSKPHAVLPLDDSLVTVHNDDGVEQYAKYQSFYPVTFKLHGTAS